jgi:hypothetical protein
MNYNYEAVRLQIYAKLIGCANLIFALRADYDSLTDVFLMADSQSWLKRLGGL